MSSFDDLGPRLAARLHPTTTPAPSETWRRLRPLLAAQRLPRKMPLRYLRVALAVLIAVLATAGLALASSPELRQQLAGLVGMAIAGDQIRGLQPSPSFQVFQPSYLPRGMRLVAQIYNPGPAARGGSIAQPAVSGGVAGPAVVESAMSPDQRSAEQALDEAARRRADILVGAGRETALVLIDAALPDRFVEVVERPAAGHSLPAGDSARVGGIEAAFTRRDGRDVLTWVNGDTFLEVGSTLGPAETQRIAEGLRVTPLADLAATQADAQPPMVIPTQVPLESRVVAVERPLVDRGLVAQRCGAWDADLNRRAPLASYDQAICVAKVVAGAEGKAGYGLSSYAWHDAAARLGLDPSVGPAGDLSVWIATFEEGKDGGEVVILDVGTGTAYLIVHLRPIP